MVSTLILWERFFCSTVLRTLWRNAHNCHENNTNTAKMVLKIGLNLFKKNIIEFWGEV